jgi:tyrosine-protein kinase Etk/Wzc
LELSNNLRPSTTDNIDLNKLRIIIKNNWLWIALIFILINTTARLFVRYTKNLYESESQLKLDIENTASELGINGMIEDPNINVASGEIEIIQSKLFLNRVLDYSHFEVSFFSVGRFLNDEQFLNPPALITYYNKDNSLYNTPISFEEEGSEKFRLKVGDSGPEIIGTYGKLMVVNNLELILQRNENFKKGDEIGYFFIINSREALLNYLAANLTAEPFNLQAKTIRISFKDYNPFKAQAVLYKIDTLYLQYSNEQKNLANNQKIDWLTHELGNIEKKMEGFENYFENFTLQNKTSNLDEDLKKTIIGINKIDSQRYESSRRVNEISALIDKLTTGENNLSFAIGRSLPGILSERIETLQQLQLEQERLKLSYHEITFAYRQKQNEIESLKTKLLNQLKDLKADWLKNQRELEIKKTRLENEFVNLPDKNTQFNKNQRFYKLYEEFYFTLMQSKSQFEIAQAGSIPDFKILSTASFPYTPISPNKVMITAIGFVASVVVIFFFVGFLYLLNNKITNLYELERFPMVSILGGVPASRYSNGTGLHIADHPKSMVSEAIRTLRTNLEFFTPSSTKKVIAISSTISGEGKSFIAMNLAGIMALSKKKVILLDLDMRKMKTNLPVATSDLSKGVSTVLIRKNSWQECLLKTAQENFDFLPAGPHPPNPSELLLNGEFNDLLEDLKQHYDFIILDTPPVGLVTDGIMAMKKADISIYVFRANYSKKEFLLNLKRIIDINKFTNITTVLNAMPSLGRTYGYGYYEESSKPNKLKSLFKS